MSGPLKVDTRVTVETPEGVDFQFQIAGPGKRSMSFIVDLLLKAGIVAVAFFFAALVIGVSQRPSGIAAGFFLLAWFAMSWLYGSCCEAFWNGQTPGKKSQNLRVVRTNGTPIGWFEAFGRNLLLVPDGMLVLGPIALNTVGLLSMAGTRRMQRLGDLVFDTMVIDETREFISRSPGITHGVEAIPRSQCSGRFHVPERTLAVIERLFEGDRLISDGRREEIARNLSVALHTRIGFEEPGPDPANPNTFFVKSPVQHTSFLKRILKTFADGDIDPENQMTAASAEQIVPLTSGRRSGPLKIPGHLGQTESGAVATIEKTAFDDIDHDVLEFDESLMTDVDELPKTGLPPDWRSQK